MKQFITILAALFVAFPPVAAQRFIRSVDSLATLNTGPVSGVAPDVYVTGANGGFFKWTAASAAATNAYNTIANPYGAASGRWIRQQAIGGTIDLGAAGLTFDGGTGDYDFTVEDVDDLSIEGDNATLTGIQSLYLDGATTTLRGTLFLNVRTPLVHAGTAQAGGALELVDATEGISDFKVNRVASISALKALPVSAYQNGAFITTLGYYTAGDGGHGVYRYDSASAATADDGSVIAPTHGTGRFLLLSNGQFNVRQFGAKGDGVTDDLLPFSAAVAYINSIGGGTLYVPQGTWLLSASVAVNRNNLRIVGAGPATVIQAGSGQTPLTANSGTRTSDIILEGFTLDGNSLGNGLLIDGDNAHRVTVRNVNFVNCTGVAIGLYSSRDVTIEGCRFTLPGTRTTSSGTSIASFEGSIGLVVRNNQFRYVRAAIVVNGGSSTSEVTDVNVGALVEGNDIDLGWYTLPSKVTNSGGTVTYSATTVVDTAENFTLDGLNTGDTVRVMVPVLTNTITTVRANQITATGATFVTSAVKRGDILRTGSAFAIVKDVQSETALELEEWLAQSDCSPTTNPSAAATFTIFSPILGTINNIAATTLTVARWYDLQGTATTPSAGAVYEVLYRRPDYPIHFEKGSRGTRVINNTIARPWSDGISLFGREAVVSGNYIRRTQDAGLTIHGNNNSIYGNRVEWAGTMALYMTGSRSVISGNTFSETVWTIAPSTTYNAPVGIENGSYNLVVHNVLINTASVGGKATMGVGVFSTTSATGNVVRWNVIQGFASAALFTGANTTNNVVRDNSIEDAATIASNSSAQLVGEPFRNITASKSLDSSDADLFVDTTAGAVVLTLPTASRHVNHRWRITKVAGGNLCTISGTVSGISSPSLKANGDYIEIYSDGAGFHRSILSRTRYEWKYVPVSDMVSATTAGPGADTLETSSNKLNVRCLLFDPSIVESAWFSWCPPDNWNRSVIKARFIWTADSGSGDVVWSISGVATSDDDALDVAQGTEQTVTDTLLAAGDTHRTSATSSITVGGSPALFDIVHFRARRNATAGGDTLAVDAALIGVWIQYTVVDSALTLDW